MLAGSIISYGRTWGSRSIPRDFENQQQLHDALAAVHTHWILDAPWSLEDPRRPGSWEEGAAAAAWTLPARAQQGTAGDREPQ